MAARHFRWLTWVLAAGLILAGLAIASALALRAYAPALARERLEGALAEALGHPVHIERVELSLWRGRAVLRNLRVEPVPGEGPEPILRLGRLQLSVGISSLWKRELVLSRILAQDLDLTIPAPSPGASPLLFDVPDTFTAGPVTVRIKAIQIERSRVAYRDPGQGIALNVQGLDGSAHPVRRGLDFTLRVAKLALDVHDHRETVTNVEGAGWIHQDQLSLRQLTGRWQERAFHIAGSVQRPFDAVKLDLTVRGEVDLARLASQFDRGLPPIAGIATVNGALQGRPDSLLGSGRLVVPLLTAGPVRARDVAIRGRWSRGTLDLPEVTARIFDGTVRGSVTMRPDRLEATRISVSLKHATLAALDTLARAPLGLRGDIDLDGEFIGDPRRPEDASGRFQLAATRLTLPGELLRIGGGTMSAAGVFRSGVAEITRAAGQWTGVEIEATGRLGMDGPAGLHVNLVADLGSVGRLWDIRLYSGQARLEGRLTGRWSDLEIAGQLRAIPFVVAGSRIDALEVSFHSHSGTVQVSTATAWLGQSRAIASGRLTWAESRNGIQGGQVPPLHFRVEVSPSALHWEDLGQWLPPAWQGTGRISLAGNVEGTPDTWRASGTLEAPSLTPQTGVPVQALRITFNLNQDQLELSQLGVQVYGIPVGGAGVWMWNGNGHAAAELGPADLARIPNLPAETGLHGTAQARIQASVRSGNVEASATVSLRGVAIRDFSVGAGSGQFSLRGGEVSGAVDFPEARLTATVHGRPDREASLAVRVEARDFNLGPLLRATGRFEGMDADGTVTVRADLQVPVSQPSAAGGTVTADPLRLTLLGEEWENRGPVTLHWGAAGLRVDRLTLASRIGSVNASGRLEPHGPIDFNVDGQFPLAVLASFRPEVRVAAGTLTVKGQVEGTAAAPRIVGEATVRNGTLQLRERPETLRDVEARIVLSPGGFRLVEAAGSLGRGRIRASGDMTLQGWQLGAYRFTLAGRNVSLSPVEGLQTAWDLDLELVGQGAKAQLRGEGRLLRGTASGRFSLLSLLLSQKPEKAAEASAAIPLRILLKLDDNLRVNMDVARLRGGGTLSLEGTTAEPVILGVLEAQEGRITFRNKRWTLVSGAIRFVDPRRIQPILDVTAQTQINEYDVTLRLSGRPDELIVSLSSSPTLPQDDLLLLVTLGTTSREAGKSPGGAVAGEMVRLLAEDLLGTTVGGGLGPDQFHLETTEKNQQVVQVGKQLTEEVRVLYSQSLSGTAKRVVRVEYQVIGPLLLAAEQDFQAGFGGDLLLRFRFR